MFLRDRHGFAKNIIGGYQTTRQADPKSSRGINIKSRGIEEETIISNFKSLAVHLKVEISDLFFEQAECTLKKYGWPRTPQTQLATFQEGQVAIELCKCGKPVFVSAKNLQTKIDHQFCKDCFSKVPMRYDAKTWHIIRRIES